MAVTLAPQFAARFAPVSLRRGAFMSNSFLFAFTVTAALTAGAVDFVHQTKVTGGLSVQEYLAALPERLGGKKADTPAEAVAVAEPASARPAGQTVDQEALRQQMAMAASQIAAAQAGQPTNTEATARAASFLSTLLKGVSKASGQPAPATDAAIKPTEAEAAIKPKASLFGNCSGTGLGKRCKVGG